MRLLFIATSIYSPQFRGGMEKYLYNLIVRLRKKHSIVLLIPHNINIKIPNVKIYHYHKLRFRFLTLVFSMISILFNLLRIIIKEKPKLISQFLPNISTLIIFPIAKLFKIKTILNLRGNFPTEKGLMNILLSTSTNFSYFFLDAIISNADRLLEQYEAVATFGQKKFSTIKKYVVFNAINSDFWKTSLIPQKKQFDISFIANLYDERRIKLKGFRYLHEALRLIEVKYKKKLKVVVIGAYSLKKIKKIIRSFNSSYFSFKGLINDPIEVKKLILNSRIYVLSSISEGMSNSLMEAIALGIPAISTDVGSTPEIISDGQNGFIVNSRDSIVLSEKIWLLLNDKELQSKFSKKGREIISQKFTWDKNIKTVEQIYKKVLLRS